MCPENQGWPKRVEQALKERLMRGNNSWRWLSPTPCCQSEASPGGTDVMLCVLEWSCGGFSGWEEAPSLASMLPFLLPLVNRMFQGDFNGVSRLEGVVAEGEMFCLSPKLISIAHQAWLMNASQRSKVSHTWWPCGLRTGFSSCAGTAALYFSMQFEDTRLSGSWGRPSSELGLSFWLWSCQKSPALWWGVETPK